MHILIGVVLVIAIAMFFMRRRNQMGQSQTRLRPAKRAEPLGNDMTSSKSAAKKLSKVSDPRLAATILMIQIVRTGAPVTAAEKTVILELIETRLKVTAPQKMFEEAWTYTENRAFFSLFSDELLPLFRDRLTEAERLDLIDMLQKTAGAYNEIGELQQSSINRLKKRLLEA